MWEPDRQLKNWIEENKNNLPDATFAHGSTLSLLNFEKSEQTPSMQLNQIVLLAAKLVSELGPSYLHIFERAERELVNAKRVEKQLAKIQSLANIKSDLIQPKFLLSQRWSAAVSGSGVFMPH